MVKSMELGIHQSPGPGSLISRLVFGGQRPSLGRGSTLNHQGTAGCSPSFHLPGFHSLSRAIGIRVHIFLTSRHLFGDLGSWVHIFDPQPLLWGPGLLCRASQDHQVVIGHVVHGLEAGTGSDPPSLALALHLQKVPHLAWVR